MRTKYLSAVLAGTLTFAAGVLVLGLPAAPPASGSPAPDSCVREINGVLWTLDPCIPEGAPLPPDLLEHIEDLAACPPESPSPSAPVQPSATMPPPTRTAVRPNAATATATATETGVPVTQSPNPSPSDDPPQCPVLTDPVPWPNYPPPGGTPSPTPPDPTPSQDPIPANCAASQTPDNGALAEPKDEKADLIQCRKPADIPDPKKPITLVGAGNSLVSAHNQTGFGLGKCDHTAADARGMVGNDANFSFVGKYYAGNPQIVEYYNFARTGYHTKDIVAPLPTRDDHCGNPWDRVKNPIEMSSKVIQAAKAAGRAAYFVADGGVNNTNWTELLAQMAKCYGLDFAINNLLWVTGFFAVQVGFKYEVPGGQKKDIIKNGGSCIITVKALGFQAWATRIEVPKYNGPGSNPEDPLSQRIQGDVTAAVNEVLNKGADKVVWLLYYDLTQARVDISNFGLAAAKTVFPDWLNRRLPDSVASLNVPIIDSAFAADVTKLTTDLNNRVKAGIPANAKVKAMDAPAFVPGDIQNTAIGGCPHPNDSGHTKLADQLKATFNAI